MYDLGEVSPSFVGLKRLAYPLLLVKLFHSFKVDYI